MTDPITFTAQVIKVATMADGGIRVTFDLPEGSTMQAAQLMECLRLAPMGRITFEPDELEGA